MDVVSGLENNHQAQVTQGSLVLEETSVKEKAAVSAGAGALLAVGMVHSGGSQDDNSSESSQLKDTPEKLQAMCDWWDKRSKRDWSHLQSRVAALKKEVAGQALGPGPKNTKTAVGGTLSSPNRELMHNLRRFQSEQARLGVTHRESVGLLETSKEVEEDSGEEEGKEGSEVEVTVLDSEEEDSVGEGTEEESVVASVVLESEKECR